MVTMGLNDYFYTKWMLAVKSNLPIYAGLSASILILGTAFVTTSYVKDKRMIIPAMVGAFLGTILGMK